MRTIFPWLFEEKIKAAAEAVKNQTKVRLLSSSVQKEDWKIWKSQK